MRNLVALTLLSALLLVACGQQRDQMTNVSADARQRMSAAPAAPFAGLAQSAGAAPQETLQRRYLAVSHVLSIQTEADAVETWAGRALWWRRHAMRAAKREGL